MTSQPFDMQSALSGGCIQQAPVSSSSQPRVTPQASNQSALQQAKQNAMVGKTQQSQMSSSPQPSQQQQTPNGGSQASGANVSSPTSTSSPQQSSVVVVTQSHQPQASQSPNSTNHSQQTTVVQQASASTPQFITVGTEEFVAVTDQGSPSQNLQPTHHTYVHYVDSTADPSNLYTTSNGQISGYSVYNVTDTATMYTPASTTYYNTGSGTAVSYSQKFEERKSYSHFIF